MSFDPVTEPEIMSWHRKGGGSGIRSSGHAVRLLREVVELCIAAGATEQQIMTAVEQECDRASQRSEFGGKSETEMFEEFADVTILSTVFRNYFIPREAYENTLAVKMDVIWGRQWEADADGVLWRPGTISAGTPGGEPERS